MICKTFEGTVELEIRGDGVEKVNPASKPRNAKGRTRGNVSFALAMLNHCRDAGGDNWIGEKDRKDVSTVGRPMWRYAS